MKCAKEQGAPVLRTAQIGPSEGEVLGEVRLDGGVVVKEVKR
jgi:hypothetical protein